MQIPDPPSGRNVFPFPATQDVPQVYLAMAAAQMHAEGRLFAQQSSQGSEYEQNWNDLSPQQQKQLLGQAKAPQTEAEKNKYDEFFHNDSGGTMVIPKSYFGPKESQWGKGWPGVDRYDLPDGRTILTKKALTS